MLSLYVGVVVVIIIVGLDGVVLNMVSFVW